MSFPFITNQSISISGNPLSKIQYKCFISLKHFKISPILVVVVVKCYVMVEYLYLPYGTPSVCLGSWLSNSSSVGHEGIVDTANGSKDTGKQEINQ